MKVLIYFNWPVSFWNLPESHLEILRKRFPEIAFLHTSDEQAAAMEASDAHVIFTSRMASSAIQNATRLKWVQSSASSVSTLPLQDLAARGILVTNTRTLQGPPIAEHVMGGLLVLARRFNLTLAAQRERRWIQNELSGEDVPWCLDGKAMTILGLGSIGSETARRAHAFGMKITAVRRRTTETRPSFVDRILGPGELDVALRGCDVLVIAAPFLVSTDRLITAREFSLMNRGALLVNVARGRIVNEADMIDALRSGQLGGAVLDVFDHEPLDTSSALWQLPDVIVTPHIASLRPNHWNDVVDLFSENLRRFRRGEPLLNSVDLTAGY
jgi:phosphoglycerate dehydrogenase-like enzyme